MTLSGSFTYNPFWKNEVSGRMKGFATTHAMHAIHHDMILIIWFKMDVLSKALCKQAVKKTGNQILLPDESIFTCVYVAYFMLPIISKFICMS